MDTLTEDRRPAIDIEVGWYLKDRSLAGTHGARVHVQWVNHYARRNRTYIAGVEEHSGAPVFLTYEDTKMVQVWHA